MEQKGSTAKVKEAFTTLVAVQREMSPYFNFPEDETPAAKEARKKKLSNLNKSLKAKKSFGVEQAQKAYKLFRASLLARHERNGTALLTRCTRGTRGLASMANPTRELM